MLSCFIDFRILCFWSIVWVLTNAYFCSTTFSLESFNSSLSAYSTQIGFSQIFHNLTSSFDFVWFASSWRSKLSNNSFDAYLFRLFSVSILLSHLLRYITLIALGSLYRVNSLQNYINKHPCSFLNYPSKVYTFWLPRWILSLC